MIEPEDEPWEMVFEEIQEPGMPLKRIGRLKTTGIIGLEIILDERRREIQKSIFDDEGQLINRVVYERDEGRKPRLTTAFDKHGKLTFRQERGKRPEVFD